MADTSALARLNESARQMITSPQALADRIREWREVAHVLTPAVQISGIAQQYAVAVSVVVLDTTVDRRGIGPEVYSLGDDDKGVPWLSKGEAAIAKVGLLKISQAAGVTWDPRYCGRTDDRKERYYWEYKAVGTYIDFTGTPQTIQATFELDLRDGSPALKGFTPAQIDATRRVGLRICESKAMNAAIRELGIRQKYRKADLEKPFVVFRVMYVPDLKDPMQRQLYAERGLGATNLLYPGSRAGAAALPDIDVPPQGTAPADVEKPAPTEALANGTKVNTTTGEVIEEKKAPPAPAPPTGPTVTDVRRYDGKAKDTGTPYARFFIKLSDGREVQTFDTEVAGLAEKLWREKAPVDVTTENTRFGLSVTELARAGARLPYDDNKPTEAELGRGPKL